MELSYLPQQQPKQQANESQFQLAWMAALVGGFAVGYEPAPAPLAALINYYLFHNSTNQKTYSICINR